MKLYNTLNRQLETFKPLNDNQVTIYSCGPTVYDRQHIGNWSAYIYWDILVRALTLNGYQVKRIINLTDVGHLTSDEDEGEDKLAKKAKEKRQTAWQIADQYIEAFSQDFAKLNLIKPYAFARATDFIDQQLDVIKQLKALGLTYQIDDGIYLDTSKIKDYGKLANLDLDKLKAGARVAFNQQKKNPTDFAVWKFSGEAKRDMEWATPAEILDQPSETTIMGFPGWHLECCTIIKTLLGDTIDIHTGGIDHIQIHHTNVIAQIEPITNQPLARFWLHNNHLKINNTKVSKSLGNTYNLDQLAEKGFSPMDLKMFVLQSHYQTEGNFSWEILEAAHNRLAKWYKIACLRHQIADGLVDDDQKTFKLLAIKQHILELANDNLNTPQILAEIDQVFDKIADPKLNLDNFNRRAFIELLEQIDQLLGLDLIANTPDVDDEIKQLLQRRQFARNNKDWAESDAIRNQLAAKKIWLDDRQTRTFWYY